MELALFVVLGLWAFGPLIAVGIHVAVNGGVLTGTNGYDTFDQFQYLAWIRDAGSHGLASDLWVVAGTTHDYLQPMYLISGLLWRAGVPIQVAYLIWKPIAVVVLFTGVMLYARRMAAGRWAALAAVVLALFYETPVAAIAHWFGPLSGVHALQLALATDDANSSLTVWGFDHAAIVIGLMPVVLVGVQRLWALDARDHRLDRRWTAIVSLSSLAIAWLHPWQIVELVGIVGATWAIRPSRRRLLSLVVPALAAALPLLYGIVLAHYDPWWHAFQSQSTGTQPGPLWAVVAAFAPLAAVAACGVRRPTDDADWMLLLWVPAVAGTYLLVPQFRPHSLTGVALPLAILAVRGWPRAASLLRCPAAVAVVVGIAAIAIVTIPAAINNADGVRDDLRPSLAGKFAQQQLRLTSEQHAALLYLDRSHRPGGVMAPWLLSMSIPGMTGRTVFAGHPQWQPHVNVGLSGVFFAADTTASERVGILRSSGTTFVVADCGAPPGLGRAIAPVAAPLRRFGCVTVYGVRR